MEGVVLTGSVVGGMLGEGSEGGSGTCLPITPMQAMQGVDIRLEWVGGHIARRGGE